MKTLVKQRTEPLTIGDRVQCLIITPQGVKSIVGAVYGKANIGRSYEYAIKGRDHAGRVYYAQLTHDDFSLELLPTAPSVW